ncbi:hypothetical protein [Actinocrispum wychmicini]|uniref:hypothetical protein n=1 Tax=Actinocrispum wychmicini TaxID=1213861 RepID=UPI001FB59865|nr:hypothetical protein [Actinocrispum wychmicini]
MNHRRFAELTERDGVDVLEVAATPGRPEVDPQLGTLGDRRLVVLGTDADLAAVVLRIMRRELLGSVVVGFVPTKDSAVLALWGVHGDAVAVALGGEVDSVPLVRDDAGGVLVGLGEIGTTKGVGYCDDTLAFRGKVSAVEVTPGPQGVVVKVIHRGLTGKRLRELHGRAFQLGTLPIVPVKDGTVHPRPMTRWTWYRHTEDLRVARGVV